MGSAKAKRKFERRRRPGKAKEQFLKKVEAHVAHLEVQRFRSWQRWKERFGPFESEVQSIDAGFRFWMRWHQYLKLTKKSKHTLGSRSCCIAYEWAIDPRSSFSEDIHPFDMKFEPLSINEIESLPYDFKAFGRILRDAMNYMDAGTLFAFDDDIE